MKNIVIIAVLLFTSGNVFANANSSGSAMMTLTLGSTQCESLMPTLSTTAEPAVRQAAKLDADYNCNQEYPGAKAGGIQRIIGQNSSCSESGQVMLEFSAVYLCR